MCSSLHGLLFDIGDVSWAVRSCLAVLSQCVKGCTYGVLYTSLAASFPIPANLIGTCGCDSLQKAVKSELPAGSYNNCCREHPSRGKIDGFCLVCIFISVGRGKQ